MFGTSGQAESFGERRRDEDRDAGISVGVEGAGVVVGRFDRDVGIGVVEMFADRHVWSVLIRSLTAPVSAAVGVCFRRYAHPAAEAGQHGARHAEKPFHRDVSSSERAGWERVHTVRSPRPQPCAAPAVIQAARPRRHTGHTVHRVSRRARSTATAGRPCRSTEATCPGMAAEGARIEPKGPTLANMPLDVPESGGSQRFRRRRCHRARALFTPTKVGRRSSEFSISSFSGRAVGIRNGPARLTMPPVSGCSSPCDRSVDAAASNTTGRPNQLASPISLDRLGDGRLDWIKRQTRVAAETMHGQPSTSLEGRIASRLRTFCPRRN